MGITLAITTGITLAIDTQPLIAHFDTQFGEAHLLVQVDAPSRITLTAYEGWAWDGLRWRLAPCLLP